MADSTAAGGHLDRLVGELASAVATGLRERSRFLFALISWELWKERNARCFRGAATQLNAVKDQIKRQAELWIMAGNKHLGSLVQRVVG
jgi:hypothetical protein